MQSIRAKFEISITSLEPDKRILKGKGLPVYNPSEGMWNERLLQREVLA